MAVIVCSMDYRKALIFHGLYISQISVCGYLSARMLSEAIASVEREMSRLVHQDRGRNSTTINATPGPYTTFSAVKSLSSSIASQSLSRKYDSMIDTPNYGGVSTVPPVPAITSLYTSHKNTFHEIEFCHKFAKYIAHEI